MLLLFSSFLSFFCLKAAASLFTRLSSAMIAGLSLATLTLALAAALPLAGASPLHGRSFVVKEQLDVIPRGWQRIVAAPRDHVLDLRIGQQKTANRVKTSQLTPDLKA
jgi:hypothetical protein